MSDTKYFDTQEKIDILLKASFGVASTSENKQWYEENSVKYNNYIFGNEILIDEIPRDPSFNKSVDVNSVGLTSGDFLDYDPLTSITDDSTGIVRKYTGLILNVCPGIGEHKVSWYKLDNSGNNILTNALQFNYKQYNDENGNTIAPYKYKVYSNNSYPDKTTIPENEIGGNWYFDIKSGVLLFLDIDQIDQNSEYNINNNDNPPVITFYKYVGKKGIEYINKLNSKITSDIALMSTNDYLSKNDIFYNTSLININNNSILSLHSKINKLVDILNNKLNLNINPDLL